jgi:hypothetical protein
LKRYSSTRERSPSFKGGRDPDTFFCQEGTEKFAAVDPASLRDADQSDALHLVPGARSVIVPGREIAVQVCRLPPQKIITCNIRDITRRKRAEQEITN